jgi:eukaryotic translation initiation factor 2C
MLTGAYGRRSTGLLLISTLQSAWCGCYLDVRHTFIHLLQHFDSVPARPLEMICGDYASVRNTRDLSILRDSQFQQLRLFIRGLKVIVNLPGHKGKRSRAIKDLVRDVGSVVFDKDGTPTTIAVCCFHSAMF